jgi:hypothetical protein
MAGADDEGLRERSEAARGGDGSADGAGARSPRGIDDPPPFWKRWGQLYWLVGGLLAADVLACWLLTRWAT